MTREKNRPAAARGALGNHRLGMGQQYAKNRIRAVLTQSLRIHQPLTDSDALDETGLRSYVEGSRLSRYVFWRKLDFVIDFAQLSPGLTVLDFGCGSGVLLPYLAQDDRQVFGVDVNLDLARYLVSELSLINVHLLDARWRTHIADRSLDVVIVANVMEHVEDRRGLLSELRLKLKPNGRLVVSGPTENRLYRFGRRLVGFTGHYHRTNVYQVFSDAREVGFQQQRCRRWPFAGIGGLYCIGCFLPT